MDQIPLNRIIQLPAHDHLPVQQSPLTPPDLPTPLFIHQQPPSQLLLVDFQEGSQLVEVHGGVEFQVGFDGGVEDGIADLVHENRRMMVHRVNVKRRGRKIRRSRRNKLRARGTEQFLEHGNGFGPPSLQAGELIAVFLAERAVDCIVELGRVEGHADGDERVHLVVFLGDGVELLRLVVLLEVLGAGDVHEDVGEHADGVGVAPHHHVAEADVVVCREMGRHDAGEHGFFVQFDVVEGFQGEGEVAKEAVDAQEADDAEVAEHAVKGAGTVFTGDGVGVRVLLHGGELGGDFGALDEGVKDVEDRVAAPGVGIIAEEGEVIVAGRVGGGGGVAGDAVTVAAEGFELVDEFINHVPGPERLSEVSISPLSYRNRGKELTEGGSRSTGPSEFRM